MFANQKHSIEFYFKFYNSLLHEKKKVSYLFNWYFEFLILEHFLTPFFLRQCLLQVEMRKSSTRNAMMNTGDLMLRNIERDVKSRRNISVQTVIFIQRAKRRWTTILPISMPNQVLSGRWFVLLVNKSSQLTTLSNNIGAKQRKPSDTVADLNKILEEEREDGEKLKGELSAC